MGKRSSKPATKKHRARQRSGRTPTPSVTAPVVTAHEDTLWADVLGDHSAAVATASTRRARQLERDALVEDAFFDRGVSFDHAALIDDADAFSDLDRPTAVRRPSAARVWGSRTVVAVVMAGAAMVLALGVGKTNFEPHAVTAARAETVRSTATACAKSMSHDKPPATAAKLPPRDRRR